MGIRGRESNGLDICNELVKLDIIFLVCKLIYLANIYYLSDIGLDIWGIKIIKIPYLPIVYQGRELGLLT